ncbi:unnamed protein product [Soboliphyme baturini]|uniref:DAO domain-containing protein n=1 Tax=Soboliphyme baturini TaxID=241478 RepID=A0A183IH71_9BILA|nr:unnamed protein product [Soboliphyme baturini]
MMHAVSRAGGKFTVHRTLTQACLRLSSISQEQEVVKEAHVVVIGGGLAGTSIAYHLAQKGVQGVVVLDKSLIGSGRSTTKSPGLITYYHVLTPRFERVIWPSIELYSHLKAVDGKVFKPNYDFLF